MKIKRLLVLLVALMAFGCLAACGSDDRKDAGTADVDYETETVEDEDDSESVNEESGDTLRIVTTIFPEYDWVREIMGDQFVNADVTMLLDNGVDLHSYQPTANDILKISGCDLFIYVGGESDEWVEDVMKDAANKDMKVINLLETLGGDVKEEEVVEGMEAEEEDGEEEEEVEYDEHVWLSLRNSQTLCTAIADTLKEIDPAHADIYDTNVTAYNEKLAALDEEYKSAVDAASNKTILFGDRFPFRYLVDDYGITYYAAFVGCSAETEASFETIMFLANKVDELGLSSICTIEGTDKKIAGTIKENTKTKDQEIPVMDSLQSTTSADVNGGKTYLSAMTDNLEVLRNALK
ncbi:MAG: zinc ABC transporter substrate-binding protein [Lachnospiraceae bacterium]|nr:zinc ABC transporter substrate-binding protein [Lachnospiraceae bacterium]